jgi:hypothetical protein
MPQGMFLDCFLFGIFVHLKSGACLCFEIWKLEFELPSRVSNPKENNSIIMMIGLDFAYWLMYNCTHQ